MTQTSSKIDLTLTPEGTLVARLLSEATPEQNLMELCSAFSKGNSPGLFKLGQHPELRTISPLLDFWLSLVENFLRAVATTADETASVRTIFDEREAKSWLWRAPPMGGGEYLTTALVSVIWAELWDHWEILLNQTGFSPRRCLEVHFPHWADVGRVNFHLAENRASIDHPFIFLATYTTRSTEKARVQHRPIGLALKDSLTSGASSNKDVISGLLRPIERAAKGSKFLESALESGKIYKPRYLSPAETHAFLLDIPVFEKSGIICKIPDFWKQQQPPRAKLRITIGAGTKSDNPSDLGLEGLVNFDASVAIGDKEVTREELQRLLAANSPLVQLNGQWVEVNPRKLQALIEQWAEATQLAGEAGMPLGKALRLLAGYRSGTSDDVSGVGFNREFTRESGAGPDAASSPETWTDIICAPELAGILDRLRTPGQDLTPEIRMILEENVHAKLRPYQLAGVGWLHLLSSLGLGGCLADDMGLGKTLQIICLLAIRKFQKNPLKAAKNTSQPFAPSLLIVPASLIGNWESELAKFAPGLTIKILHPNYSGSIRRDDSPDLYITTYSMLHRIPWISEVEWGCAIADEAQAIKNADTRQSIAARSIKAQVRFALTGTPVENHLGDLWSIFDFTCPGLLGSQQQFNSTIKSLEGRGFASLRTLISPYLLRRSKTDKSVIADLPDKIELQATCDLSLRQVKLYQNHVDFLNAALKKAAEEGASAIDRRGLVLASLMKFKQICNHPSQYENDNQYTPGDSGKFEKLRELVETIASRQERLLVFTQFREITDVLQHFLSGLFKRQGLVLHGGTPVSKRQEMVDEFQQPGGPPFFVLSLKAGGTGLNLTRAQHVIHFDRWWNPAVENQATDRAFRIGQKSNVIVHKFVCRGTLEEKIDKMIASKKSLADRIVEGGGEVSLTELSNDELLALVRLDIGSLG